MNLDQITTKCWILALFERDDGERLLLGDGWYDFKDSLQHFQPNNIASDIVELQGTDGQLLAGQVRRTASQSFDGYVGDALTSKTEIENRRRQFIQFFRVRRFYKVIYIFPDGSAIQRKRGYLTDAPSVPEMWQKFPEYHVSLSFEDVNYYEYSEDEQGKEIYANTALIELLNLGIGGLVWDSVGAVSHGYTWLEPVTLTGDYITISDGLDSAPLSLTELDGNATQTTYSGKNLLPPASDFTTTRNGITFKGVDGIYTLTGTATANANSDNYTTTASYTIQSGDYLHIGNSSVQYSVAFVLNFTDSTKADPSLNAVNRIVDLSAYVGKTISSIRFFVANGVNVGTLTISPMIVKSSSATAYEPYVGGTASPNPDYPQAIDVVTGEQTVKITGKNLADLPENTTLPMATNPVTVFDNGNDITVSSLVMTFILQNAIYTAAGGALIDFQKADGTHNYRTTPQIRDSDNVQPPLNTAFSGTYYWKQTTSLTFRKVNVYLGAGYANWTQGTASVQLELNTTDPTAYEPYQGQVQEINLGKNLFDISKVISGNRLINNGDGTLTVTTSSGDSSAAGATPNTLADYCPTLKAGDVVTLSAVSTGTQKRIYLNGANIMWDFGTTKTITATMLTSAVLWYASGVNTTATVSNIQLEAGSTATSYAPYFTPIELAKIGTYQDRIYKNDEKWYIEKQVGKVVLDGTESWQTTSSTGGAIYYYRNSDLWINIGSTETAPLLTNYYSPSTLSGATSTSITNICFLHNNVNYIGFKNSSVASLADWKTWLASNPTTVYYALATPTTTEITDETLLEQLEHIYSLYDGVNHISITPTAGAQGTMEVKYYTVLDTTGAGYEWEPGGGSSTTTVEVAGIDNAEPIWTVTGPATNPTLTNITTGQAITWNGTVPSGQTLTVDMGEQTATLAGANVYQFISGSWITLRPGPNKLSYSATGGAESPSQLEWNGVVG